MKHDVISKNKFYWTTINGVRRIVKVNKISADYKKKPPKYEYVVEDLAGKKFKFQSAAKFTKQATTNELETAMQKDPLGKVIKKSMEIPGLRNVENISKEGKKGSDPTRASGTPRTSAPVSAAVRTAGPSPVINAPASRFLSDRPIAGPNRGLVPTAGHPGASAVVPTSGFGAVLSRDLHDSTEKVPHLIVKARAGTGKTWTIVKGIGYAMNMPYAKELTPSEQQLAVWEEIKKSFVGRRFPPKVCVAAFNSPIAKHLTTVVPPGVDAMTMHKMGLRAVYKSFRLRPGEEGIIEGNGRVNNIMEELTGINIHTLRSDRPYVLKGVGELVRLCKMNLVAHEPAVSDDEFYNALDVMVSHYQVELEDDDGNDYSSQVYPFIRPVLERCKDVNRDGCIDMNDMIWLPVVLDLPIFKWDVLFVDEAQDLNRCQQAIAKRCGRRLVLVGDECQAIYGFTGADADSLPNMEKELGETEHGVKVLPLTVTRRCGKAIVEEARKLVPDFEAFPENGPGIVRTTRYRIPDGQQGEDYTAEVRPGDMILCRVNAPLVTACFKFLKRGVRASIQGRNMVKGIVDTIKGFNAATVVDLLKEVDNWCHAEIQREQAKRNPSEGKLIFFQDKADCIRAFCEGAQSVEDVINGVYKVFGDEKEKGGVLLSSIHKAKGLEADRVFFINCKDAPCPHPTAKSAWQKGQEKNLCYVAITRAIKELIYVT